MDSDTVYFCPECGTQNVAEPGEGGRRARTCGPCVRELGERKFRLLCPPLYRHSEEARLPAEQRQRADAWKFGPVGLLFTGESGKGKTRLAWRTIKRVFLERRLSFASFDCVSFGHAVAGMYSGYSENPNAWLEEVAIKDLVFFDDLGKLKMTERAETELFGLIERRCSALRPIIATTNDSGDSLAARMSENRGPSLIRRLREFCEVITF